MRRPIHHLRGEETLGWGIIGAAAIAANRAVPAIRNQPPIPVAGARYPMTDSWVAGIYSHNEHRAAAFADANQIAHTYTNLSDLLKRSDVHCIYIACHPRHHASFALAALAADKHVFCEPPLALATEEAQAVIHTAANRGLTLAVNYAHRADAALLALRELMLDDEIGELLGGRISNTTFLRPAQQTWRLGEQGGGVLFDRTSHSIDALRFLLRDEVAAIDSMKHQQIFGGETRSPAGGNADSHTSSQVEEDVLSRITMRRTGYTFQCHDSFIIPHQPTELELYGSGGILIARHCFDHDKTSELYLRRRGEDMRIRIATNDPFHSAIARFHAAIRHGEPVQAGGPDGLAVLTAILAAKESIRRRHRIELPERPRLVTDTSHI
jgi:1,5-anhydro-D-fructose reductase (1,5-anhydro-D-mannitol-forming)